MSGSPVSGSMSTAATSRPWARAMYGMSATVNASKTIRSPGPHPLALSHRSKSDRTESPTTTSSSGSLQASMWSTASFPGAARQERTANHQSPNEPSIRLFAQYFFMPVALAPATVGVLVEAEPHAIAHDPAR